MGCARREGAVYLLVTVAAVLSAYLLVRGHGLHLVHDARGYHVLSQSIVRAGLFHFSDVSLLEPDYQVLPRLRTYGYPLFEAGCALLADGSPEGTQAALFSAQLALFLGVCGFASRALGRHVGRPGFGWALYVATALNPWLLIRTVEATTDSLSISLVALAFTLLIRACLEGGVGGAAAALFVAGFAVMVRPANLPVAGALGLVWLLNPYQRWLIRLAALPALALAFAVPFVPQAVNNHRLCGAYRPLVVADLSSEVQSLGARVIKAATFDHPHDARLLYKNPLLPAGCPWQEFRREWPARYAGTLALHAFVLFDQDSPFTYLCQARSWYRWPSSVLGFAFLGLCAAGAAVALRPGPVGARGRFVLLAALGAVVCQGLAYLPVAVEARFGASLHLLLSPFLVSALAGARDLLAARRYGALAVAAGGLGLFVLACCGLSAWLDNFVWVYSV